MLCLAHAGFAADVASSPTDDALLTVKFDQKLDNRISLDLPFRDERGKIVRLGDYFGSKPVILNLGYYGCPMLCTLVMNGMVESLQDLKASMGNQFDVICVSIDPNESPQLATAKKRTYLRRYGRPGSETGWHFLTGDEASIRKLTDEVGFHYAYDSASKQFAHPSGFIILTPDGKVSRYFFGVTYSAKEVDVALKQAGARQTGSRIEQLILLCFHYSPITSKYGSLIMGIVRASGVVTIIALGLTLYVTARRRRKHLPKEAAI